MGGTEGVPEHVRVDEMGVPREKHRAPRAGHSSRAAADEGGPRRRRKRPPEPVDITGTIDPVLLMMLPDLLSGHRDLHVELYVGTRRVLSHGEPRS